MSIATQRAAARATNPNCSRLDEIDQELDRLAADLAATKEANKRARWALMKERIPLFNEDERAINLWSFVEDMLSATKAADKLTPQELCVYAMNHAEADAKLQAVLGRIYDLAGYKAPVEEES